MEKKMQIFYSRILGFSDCRISQCESPTLWTIGVFHDYESIIPWVKFLFKVYRGNSLTNWMGCHLQTVMKVVSKTSHGCKMQRNMKIFINFHKTGHFLSNSLRTPNSQWSATHWSWTLPSFQQAVTLRDRRNECSQTPYNCLVNIQISLGQLTMGPLWHFEKTPKCTHWAKNKP
jgi:hypothetical protein